MASTVPTPNAQPEPDLLAGCPWCGYSLNGLPEQHQCPECGAAIDRRWEVFGGMADAARRARIRRPLTVFLAIVLGYVLFSMILGVILSGEFVAVLFQLTFLTPLAVIFLQRFRRRSLITVGPDGIQFFHGRERQSYLSWPAVRGAEFVMKDWRLYIYRTQGDPEVVPFGTYMGGFMPDVDRFVRAVNEERLAYYARTGESAPDAEMRPHHKPGEPAPLRFPIS